MSKEAEDERKGESIPTELTGQVERGIGEVEAPKGAEDCRAPGVAEEL